MTKVALQFYGRTVVELGEIIFDHPLLEKPVLAVRGRTHGAHQECASFPWGSVAKAFSLLMVRTKAFGTVNGFIEGDGASLASPLDYAISKPPVWFQELFGSDRFGVTLARRIFHRTNPERKRPGPVRITVNANQLSPEDIQILWDGAPITEPKAVRELLASLERALENMTVEIAEPQRTRASESASSPGSGFEFKSALRQQYVDEVLQSLIRPDVFTRRGLLSEIETLKNNPSFKRILPRSAEFLSGLSEDIGSNVRLGCVDPRFLNRYLRDGEPIKVWVTAVQPTNYALVRYLIDVKGYNIDVEYRFNYGTELARQTVDPKWGEGPDFCFAGVGPAIHIYNNARGRYHPCLLAPTLSHAVMAHHEATDAGFHNGEYHFVVDDPTTASFCYDQLCREGTLKKKALKLQHAEPEDVMRLYATADADFRSLLWFPHYEIYKSLFNAKVSYSSKADAFNQFTVGFVHERLKSSPARFLAFQAALRDAWLSLRESPQRIQHIVDGMLSDPEYTKFVARTSGLHLAGPSHLRAA